MSRSKFRLKRGNIKGADGLRIRQERETGSKRERKLCFIGYIQELRVDSRMIVLRSIGRRR